MANVRIYGFHTAAVEEQNTALANGIEALAGYSLAFMDSSTAWPDTVPIDSTCRFSCVIDGATRFASKVRAVNSISIGDYGSYYLTYTTSPGISSLNSIGAGYTTGSPKPWECLEIYFEHGNSVAVDPCEIWISSGSGGLYNYTLSSVWIMETSASGSQNWQVTKPSSKMNLTPHESATQHGWLIGLSMKPLVNESGFDATGYLQIDITYS